MTIAERLTRCNDDERKVMERVLQGIEKGRAVYGPLNLASDRRDLVSEADDEVRDFAAYVAMQRVLNDLRRGRS
jgi:hypothetical protein